MRLVKLKYLLIVIYSVVIALLLASVIHSGYSYIFDPDELVHINMVYMLRHGFALYRDIIFTYTPIFQWFLIPVSYLTGFTFHFLEASRIAMIGLFIIRLLMIFFITRKLFGSLVAYLCIPLSLFDSFTVFSGMQVRPDNLMMTMYLVGILFLVHWYGTKQISALLGAGLLMGISVVILVKNIPATFIVTLFALNELRKTRSYRTALQFILVMILPAVCFVVWARTSGLFPFMIQQLVVDAKHLNDTLKFPENILNYYWPPNFVLYGFPGRPLTWAYELLLPLVAFAGMFTTFLNVKGFGAPRRLVGWFAAACLLQWVSLLFVRSVFIQYFLSVSWFLAVFAAYALTRVYEAVGTNRLHRQMAALAGVLLLIGGLAVSWRANNTRAMSSYAAQKAYLETQWRIIPDTAVVFPGALFRLSTYPMGYGTNFVDLSPEVARRYDSPSVYLEKYHIPFVVLDPYNFSFLDIPTQKYIRAHYQQNLRDQSMWTLRS